MADDTASLVWSTKPDLAAALKKLPLELLAAYVTAAFQLPWESISFLNKLLLQQSPAVSPSELLDNMAWRSTYDVLGPERMPDDVSGLLPPKIEAVQDGSVASFPLRYSHALEYLGRSTGDVQTPNRTVLIGDAAHNMHPLAGQGLNAGLSDVASLHSAISAAVAAGADIGTPASLQPYPRQRYIANHGLLSATDKLHKLFARQEGPLVWARSTGMDVINQFPSLKALFMGQAGAAGSNKSSSFSPVSLLAKGAQTIDTAAQVIGFGLAGLRSRISASRSQSRGTSS